MHFALGHHVRMPSSTEQVRRHLRRTRRLRLSSGDPGQVRVTKIGGVPWWPRGCARPRCQRGHDMAFFAQVRLSDVPMLASDRALLSFHYCLACADAGEMSFGYTDEHNRGYAVTLLDDAAAAPDDLGIVVPSCLPAKMSRFSDVDEVLSLEDAWALELSLPPELFADGEDDFDENIGLGLVHVARAKVGGWPTWQQTPEWPICHEGRRMHFVTQIDWDLGSESPWAGGGYAYLFACGRVPASPGRSRRADNVTGGRPLFSSGLTGRFLVARRRAGRVAFWLFIPLRAVTTVTTVATSPATLHSPRAQHAARARRAPDRDRAEIPPLDRGAAVGHSAVGLALIGGVCGRVEEPAGIDGAVLPDAEPRVLAAREQFEDELSSSPGRAIRAGGASTCGMLAVWDARNRSCSSSASALRRSDCSRCHSLRQIRRPSRRACS